MSSPGGGCERALALPAESSPLFAPFVHGALRLSNRIVMAPMTRSFSPGGVPGPDVAAYYRRRAESGVGLILTEGTWVPHPLAANNARVPRFHGEDALAGWSHVVGEVHAAGGKIMPQLWHTGLIARAASEADSSPGERRDGGPSGLLGGLGWPIVQAGRGMTLREIDEVVEAFAQAAASAQRLGFDGVELHGAHGYLIDQFLWDRTNLRTDGYGGSPAARARFAAEIVRAIRDVTGPDFPILFRFSQWKLHDYRAELASGPAVLQSILEPLVEAGVDLFDCSQRRFWEPAFDGDGLNLAGWTRKLSGRPTITVGSVSLDQEFSPSLAPQAVAKPTSISRLIEMLERGDFDLVGVGRALLADANWPEKVRSGRFDALESYAPASLSVLH